MNLISEDSNESAFNFNPISNRQKTQSFDDADIHRMMKELKLMNKVLFGRMPSDNKREPNTTGHPSDRQPETWFTINKEPLDKWFDFDKQLKIERDWLKPEDSYNFNRFDTGIQIPERDSRLDNIDFKVQRPTHVSISSDTGWGHPSNLENVLWVALGGFVVMVLMAIFMKLGNPIRRVRRQLSNARPAPNVITRRRDPDDRNLDTGSLLRLTESAAAAHDAPPPYSECARTDKRDTEEPPPPFSACFVTCTSTKDTEPKYNVHIKQNVLFEDESFDMNDSEGINGMRTELVPVNGRIVETPKLDLDSHSNDTEVATNDKVKESKHAHFKGRVVYNGETDHVKVNIY